MCTHLTIDVREQAQQRVVLAIAGEVDIATAPLLARALLSYPECDVTVDLSGVGFLDASGLAALVQASARLQDTGHTLRTTGEREFLLAVMRITDLLDVFHGTGA